MLLDSFWVLVVLFGLGWCLALVGAAVVDALIYRGSLNRTKLYELSSPSRPGGAVFSRVERRGGGTGFLRVEIERWLRGFPVRDKEKAAGASGDQPKGKAEIRRLDASVSTVTPGRAPVKVAAGREGNP